MSSSVKSALGAALSGLLVFATAGAALAQVAYPGIGRAATAKEIAAWDIDVRPDFKGLPPGSGSVDQGIDLWEERCASCHGVFGESNEVFTPLVGGTTAEDVKTGHVARLNDRAYPGRTTMMKLATVSTLWDYIFRAMPWNAPKSLTPDQVYAVLAYLLNLAEVVPADYVLSDRNIAQVQQRLPNRKGMNTRHHLWPGQGMGGLAPDVKSVACMNNCAGEPDVASFLPDFARNAHGNLAEQNRMVGAQHGADTSRPAGALPAPAAPPAPTQRQTGAVPTALLVQRGCTACHGVDSKIVGPGFSEIARKYADRTDREAYLAGKIVSGGSGQWGSIPMPAQTLAAEEVKTIAAWLAAGAPK
ncbi:MAG: c-type cytochrome [Rubrivivax sp.]|jgi:cytochrome c551/c552|nr:c-type cytochrome [Rubrivivax sp.]